jgi:hypothetical protein
MIVVRMDSWFSTSVLAFSVAILGACGTSGDDKGTVTGGGSSSGASSSGGFLSGASSSGASGSGASGSGASSSGASSSGASSSGGSSSGSGSGSSSGTAGNDGGLGNDAGAGGDSGANGDSAGGSSGGPGSYTCFPAGSGTDFTSDGPLTATSADVTSVSCTIYQPTQLGSSGCLNPVIVWGNGTFNTPASYDALFKHFASHGFIVAAADTSNSGSGMEMLACLTYILGQNMSGSTLQGHVDVNHIASSGYSQGGAGSLAAGEDPRFTTDLAVSAYMSALGNYDPSMYAAKQIHPLFLISGSADTVATPSVNQQPIFNTAPVPIFWATHSGSTHLEVLGAGGVYAGPMTAWFRWKLMGDPNAEKWFEKPDCQLCSASGWMVQTNSKWQ